MSEENDVVFNEENDGIRKVYLGRNKENDEENEENMSLGEKK